MQLKTDIPQHINALKDKHNCSGCTACKSVCPKHCITMLPDEEGFLYPHVNENLCINCGLCKKICPLYNEYSRPTHAFDTPKVYAAKHIDADVRMQSTSGGIFTAISDMILSQKGIVCGAIFEKNEQKIKHIIAWNKEDRNNIRGSKYAQSDLENIFTQIKILLDKGVKVLFTGTPCQTAGLLAFLQKDYENLLLVDILCHSIPSPLIFKHALENTDANSICFRNKQLGWRKSYEFSMTNNEDKKVNTTYLTLFFKGLINRPSCYNCHFTNVKRASDMTIGDYWNINRVQPTFEDKLGVSCVLINSPKGMAFFEQIKNSLDYLETDLIPALQECLQRPVTELQIRKTFWNDYRQYGYEWCTAKYGHKTIIDKIKDYILAPIVRKLPIRGFIRKLRNKI